MVDIIFESEEPLNRSAQELGVAQPISHVLVSVFVLDFDIILVALAMVVVLGDRPVPPQVLPLSNVLEPEAVVEGGVRDEAVFVGEGVLPFFDGVSPGKPDIL